MGAIDTLIEAVYPPHCLACAEIVGAPGALCPACWSEATFLAGTRCHACGAPLPGEDDGGTLRCDDCLAAPRPWSAGRAALAYSGTGRRLVLSLKAADRTDLPRAAAGWMAAAGRDLIAPGLLVAPVPLHRWRLFRRRYNQSALLSGALARDEGLEHCPDLLVRRRATASQDGRSREARFENVAGAIAVHPGRRARLAGRAVLLVDDVMTSGATLAAAAEACLAGGAADVRALALARVLKSD
jgi:predicted amidophosphoribosyltransferase